MDDRTHRQVLTYRVVSGVFAGPGGWIVWAKFDPGPYATCIRTPDEGRLVLGRLVET